MKPDGGLLSGLCAALEHCPTDYAMILSADRPLLKKATLTKLIKHGQIIDDIIVVSNGQLLEPLIALYHTRTLSFWKDRLANNRFRLIEGIKLQNHRVLDLSANKNELLNINTPNDLAILKFYETKNS